MKRWTSIVAVAGLALSVSSLITLGCAGSDSGSGTPTVPTLGIVGEPRIEAVYVPGLNPTSPLLDFADTLNIQTGERVQFQLVGYTAGGQRVVLTDASGWVTSDTEKTFGEISANSGVFTATDRQSDTALTVATRFNGRDYVTFFRVRPRAVRVIGSVLSKKTGLPVRDIELRFYNSNGIQVSQTRTQFDGSFRAAVPRDAVRFQVFNDTIPSTFLNLIKYVPGLEAERVKPDYLNNRNASGAVLPITIDPADESLFQWQKTGLTESCKPAFSTTAYETGDYYMPFPILLAPSDEPNPTGTGVIDPNLVSVGCTP